MNKKRLRRIETAVASVTSDRDSQVADSIFRAMTDGELVRFDELAKLRRELHDSQKFETTREYLELAELYQRAKSRVALAERRGDPGAFERLRLEVDEQISMYTALPRDYMPNLSINGRIEAWTKHLEWQRETVMRAKLDKWSKEQPSAENEDGRKGVDTANGGGVV